MEQNQIQTNKQTGMMPYKPNLKNALLKGDKSAVQMILRDFKTQSGAVNYPVVFSIPSGDRLVKLSENDFSGTLSLVTVGVTLAMDFLNLKIPLNAIQILDLSEAIIDSSGEDNLALEDLMLFLQGLTRGKYGPMYESLDVPKFMGFFEKYRQERHEAILRYRENEHLTYKSIGNPERASDRNTAFDEHLSSFTTKLANMKDELHEAKGELKRRR